MSQLPLGTPFKCVSRWDGAGNRMSSVMSTNAASAQTDTQPLSFAPDVETCLLLLQPGTVAQPKPKHRSETMGGWCWQPSSSLSRQESCSTYRRLAHAVGFVQNPDVTWGLQCHTRFEEPLTVMSGWHASGTTHSCQTHSR